MRNKLILISLAIFGAACLFVTSFLLVSKPIGFVKNTSMDTLVSDTMLLNSLSQTNKANNILSVVVEKTKQSHKDYSMFYLPDGTLKPEVLTYILSQEESNKQVSIEHLFSMIDSGEISNFPNKEEDGKKSTDLYKDSSKTNSTELVEIVQTPKEETKINDTAKNEVTLEALLAEITGGN